MKGTNFLIKSKSQLTQLKSFEQKKTFSWFYQVPQSKFEANQSRGS